MHDRRDDIATREGLDEEHSAVSEDWFDHSHDLVQSGVAASPVTPYRDSAIFTDSDFTLVELE
jgi:hypothetical protein